MTNPRTRAAALRPLLLTLLLAAAGCASSPRTTESGEEREVEITVENQNFKDAVVYAIWGAGPRDRLGMVTGNTTQTFSTEAESTGEVRVEVDFIGAGPVETQSIGVFEGDQIRVVIPPGI